MARWQTMVRQPYKLARRARGAILIVAAIAAAACGGSASPTAPGGSGSSDVLSLDVSCPVSLIIGEKAPCVAVARLRSGQMPLVPFDAAWTSARPDIVAVDATGVVHGRSGGEAAVTASYRGRQAAASIAVIEVDALRVKAAADQGEFRRARQ